jgi:hypothetical protein
LSSQQVDNPECVSALQNNKIIIYNSGIKLHQKVAGQKSLLVGPHAATENDGA